MYQLIRPCLFRLNPETAHHVTLFSLQWAYRLGLTRYLANSLHAPRTVMGLHFPNPIGLAAGLDVNACYVDALASLGFGFIEVGAVTPKPQTGNPKPRLFRLEAEQGIINRMGFHNQGVSRMAANLEKSHYKGILGINIAKNRDTPIENAADDYLYCIRQLWKYASYFTINISSPNTPGLRHLQQADYLQPLLSALKHEQTHIKQAHHKYIPLVVKLSPDLTQTECEDVAAILIAVGMDGVIATNTTIQRDTIATSPHANETGGLSGNPLRARSTEMVRALHTLLQDKIPLIGLGGVMDETSAKEKMAAGASLLQIYTGLVYAGPALIQRLVSAVGTQGSP